MTSYFEFLKSLSLNKKKSLFYIFITYFLVLFAYPLIRSAVGAYFYEYYTASEYSLASFFAIIFLVVCIYISNRLQRRVGIQALYLGICVFAVIVFVAAYFLLLSGVKEAAFVLFALKESYIVLLVHLCLAYSNGFFNFKEVKKLFGPIGAIGSIGGIVGGLFTANFARSQGTEFIFFAALLFIFLAGVSFYQTKKVGHKAKLDEVQKEKTPLSAIKPVMRFVILIATIVALSQWVIFIADLQFNIVFEKLVTSKDARTAYLGNIYSYINMISLFIQFLIIPYMLSRVSNRFIFLSIPILYSFLTAMTIGLGASSMFISAGMFVMMKASDYSIFAYSKEVLYHGLTNAQKYGAKYITDMFVYRLAKALIAIVMSILSIKNLIILNISQIVFIVIWLVCVILLFRTQKKEIK